MSGYFLAIIFALILQAFFSGTETAMVSCNRIRIRSLLEKGNKRARIIWVLMQNPKRFLATTLVGTNLAVVSSSALATLLFVELFSTRGPVIAAVVIVPLVLIFGEMLPKAIFRTKATQLILFVAPIISLLQKLLFPIVRIMEFLAAGAVHILGVKKREKRSFLTKEDIKLLLQQTADEGVLEEEEEEKIHRVFEFQYRRAGDILIELDKVRYIDYDQDRETILAAAKKYGFTRYPVFKDSAIVGVINVFDLFYHDDDWHKYIRQIRYTDTDQRIDQLFSQMKPNKETMAAVMKKGKLTGIVTVADIMEEVLLP